MAVNDSVPQDQVSKELPTMSVLLAAWDVLKDAGAVMDRTGCHFSEVLTRRSNVMARIIDRAQLDCGRLELLEKCAESLWQAQDMINDGPDDSDVAWAHGKLAEAADLARQIHRGSLT